MLRCTTRHTGESVSSCVLETYYCVYLFCVLQLGWVLGSCEIRDIYCGFSIGGT